MMLIQEPQDQAIELTIIATTPAPLDAVGIVTLRSHLLEHGAVLLRGFTANLPAFEALVHALADIPLVQGGHRDASSQSDVVQGVNPGSDAIGPHCENAFTPIRPDVAFFYCERPASTGGETTLTSGVQAGRDLDAGLPWLSNALVRYHGRYARPVWSRMLGCEALDAARAALTGLAQVVQRGSGIEFTFELRPDGVLAYDYATPAMVVSRHGRRAFADSYFGFPTEPPAEEPWPDETVWVTCDRPEFSGEAARATVETTLEAHTRDVRLAPGDVLVLDNWSVLHGRRAFTGPRRVHAAFAYASWLRPLDRGPIPAGLSRGERPSAR